MLNHRNPRVLNSVTNGSVRTQRVGQSQGRTGPLIGTLTRPGNGTLPGVFIRHRRGATFLRHQSGKGKQGRNTIVAGPTYRHLNAGGLTNFRIRLKLRMMNSAVIKRHVLRLNRNIIGHGLINMLFKTRGDSTILGIVFNTAINVRNPYLDISNSFLAKFSKMSTRKQPGARTIIIPNGHFTRTNVGSVGHVTIGKDGSTGIIRTPMTHGTRTHILSVLGRHTRVNGRTITLNLSIPFIGRTRISRISNNGTPYTTLYHQRGNVNTSRGLAKTMRTNRQISTLNSYTFTLSFKGTKAIIIRQSICNTGTTIRFIRGNQYLIGGTLMMSERSRTYKNSSITNGLSKF